ncbi:MAG: hypothetical protein JWP30_2139 [Homoserinimonas sp.]|nr:hypothetical protein [Homoserinimonas sp.]
MQASALSGAVDGVRFHRLPAQWAQWVRVRNEWFLRPANADVRWTRERVDDPVQPVEEPRFTREGIHGVEFASSSLRLWRFRVEAVSIRAPSPSCHND